MLSLLSEQILSDSNFPGAAYTYDGVGDHLSQTPAQSAASGASDLSILVTRRADHASEPSLEYGYSLYPIAWRLCLPGRGDGLVQPVWAVMGGVNHHGCGVLLRGVGASTRG